MQVKYAAGIVKNRVTADRRVTCAIEHVGPVPLLCLFSPARIWCPWPPRFSILPTPHPISHPSASPPLHSLGSLGRGPVLARESGPEEAREEARGEQRSGCQRFWHGSTSTRVLLRGLCLVGRLAARREKGSPCPVPCGGRFGIDRPIGYTRLERSRGRKWTEGSPRPSEGAPALWLPLTRQPGTRFRVAALK